MEDQHQHRSEPNLSGGSKGVTQYICPMHPEVKSEKPGSCPKCGMTMAPRKVQKRTLRLAAALSVAMLLASCGDGREQTEHKAESAVPREQAPAVHSAEQQSTPSNMHAPRGSLVNDFAHKNIVLLDSPYHLGSQARAEMEQVVHAYLQLALALVDDNETAADKATDELSEKVGSVVPTRLEGKGLDAWKDHQIKYAAKLNRIEKRRIVCGLLPYGF